MFKLSVLLSILACLTNALPLQSGVLVKQVVAIESVVVDGQGNRIGVQKSVIDANLLQAANNDIKSALEAHQKQSAAESALQVGNGNGDYKPVIVDVKTVPVMESGSAGAQFAYNYARQQGLRSFYILASAGDNEVTKSALTSLPYAEVRSINTIGELEKAPLIDYLSIPAGVSNKRHYLMAALPAFSHRAVVHFEGHADSSALEVLQEAGWHLAHSSPSDTLLTRANPKDSRTVMEQTLDSVFAGLLAPNDKRYATMRRVAELAILRGAKVFVETGTARNGDKNCGGDGCSTIIFGRLMELIASISPKSAPLLYTVDINPQAIQESRKAASLVSSRISYHATDSVKFLDAFAQPIDVFYLDSYDFNGANPQPSQRHHLKELVMSWDNLHPNTVIIVDDCGLSAMGKCKLVDEHLMYAGWKLDTAGYQRVYVKQ